jgi:hypothetical protein
MLPARKGSDYGCVASKSLNATSVPESSRTVSTQLTSSGLARRWRYVRLKKFTSATGFHG